MKFLKYTHTYYYNGAPSNDTCEFFFFFNESAKWNPFKVEVKGISLSYSKYEM